tara:strand:- start:98 stop:325 length:228 start_codon:yes stop_codon:yes gene_type:complete
MHCITLCNLLLEHDTMREFKYEMTGTMREGEGWTKCADNVADQWSVYERDSDGLAVWVADFARQQDAINFLEILE